MELVDDDYTLGQRAYPLLQVLAIDAASCTVTLAVPKGIAPWSLSNDPHKHPLLRRWDQGAGANAQGVLPVVEGTAITLEDTGVQAYQGQAAFIKSQAVFKAAISIHPVEARHAAWIRQLAHQNPAPAAFNPSMTKSQVLAAVAGTGFIKS